MRVCNCENPRYIKNKYTGERVLVSCGHCNTCLNTKGSEMVNRLKCEYSKYKYAAFIFLSYAPDKCPQFVPYYDADGVDFVNTETKESYHFDYLPSMEKDLRYVINRTAAGHPLLLASKKSIQKFVKNLRYYAKEKFNEKIRYHIISEYGPTTQRPHHHGIIFFNSDSFANAFRQVLSKSWKYGISNFSFSNSEASIKYCSKYLSCVANLPTVLKTPISRPFVLSSRKPAIGSLSTLSDQEIQKIFYEGATSRTCLDNRNLEIVDVPYERCVADYFFPRIKGFNRLSHSDRVTLYNYATRPIEDWEQAITGINFRTGSTKLSDDSNILYDYLKHITDNFALKPDSKGKYKCYPFENFVATLNRARERMNEFHVSPSEFVRLAEQFYSNKELKTLKNFYESQQSKSFMNLDSRVFYLNKLYDDFRQENDDFSSCRLLEAYITSNIDYVDMLTANSQIAKKASKTREKNDYLEAHPDLKVLCYNLYD